MIGPGAADITNPSGTRKKRQSPLERGMGILPVEPLSRDMAPVPQERGMGILPMEPLSRDMAPVPGKTTAIPSASHMGNG